MSISSISGSTNTYQAYQTSGQNNFAQLRQAFQALASTLQSGDMTGAQNAFATLQQLLPNSSAGNQTQNGQQGSNQSPFATDLNAVGQALQSGNVSDAQEAFAKLQQDMQSIQGHHHHHINGSAGTQGSGENPFATDLNAVGQALQSGDLSGAQQDFAKLQQDVQSYNSNGASTTASTLNTTVNETV
jgi:soluble cytochrome b562